MKRFALVTFLLLAGCGPKVPVQPVPPVVETVEVKVPTPVPCAALAKLGPEPEYADTAAAIKAAPDIFEAARLMAMGRLARIKRLAEYAGARAACQF